ncbi:hypothetical protein PSI03_22155, partial [Pseudoalteromonas sp. GAB2316C]|nr:hypothetical protein [Pseudoalteromonas sp. GAB2316C]
RGRISKNYFRDHADRDIDICLGHGENTGMNEKLAMLFSHPALRNVGVIDLETDHHHLTADVKPEFSVEIVREEVERLIGKSPARATRRRAVRKGIKDS